MRVEALRGWSTTGGTRCRYALGVPPDVIIGQQRVIGLLAFFATPLLLLAIPADVVALFLGGAALGVFLLFIERFRSVGVGVLAGTIVTFGVLLLLATMLSGVD